MSTYGAARARYASDAVETVSPARLLTMLYDRLVTDLVQAEEAMTNGEHAVAGDKLGHAQAILLELHSTLDTSVWAGAEALNQLYVWILGELMRARQTQQPKRVADCRVLLEPLRDAWHTAAGTGSAPPDPSTSDVSPLTGTIVAGTVGPQRDRPVSGAA